MKCKLQYKTEFEVPWKVGTKWTDTNKLQCKQISSCIKQEEKATYDITNGSL